MPDQRHVQGRLAATVEVQVDVLFAEFHCVPDDQPDGSFGDILAECLLHMLSGTGVAVPASQVAPRRDEDDRTGRLERGDPRSRWHDRRAVDRVGETECEGSLRQRRICVADGMR